MKAIFRKVISNIKLQKGDLKKIFQYTYKYKIAICVGGLLFYQSGNLKITIATFFYFIETLLLLTGSLGYK